MKRNLSVIIPTLNEEKNIGKLISCLNKDLSPLEIIVVDDHSSDHTPKIVRSQIKIWKNVRLISHNPPLGLTKSLQKAVMLASGKYLSWLDADFSHPPSLLKKMYSLLLKNRLDIVSASWLIKTAHDKRREKFHSFFSTLINKLCSLLFDKSLTCYTSGYILIKKEIAQIHQFLGNYGEYYLNLIVESIFFKRRIQEISFVCQSRQSGQSKTTGNLFSYFLKGLGYLKMIFFLIKKYKLYL